MKKNLLYIFIGLNLSTFAAFGQNVFYGTSLSVGRTYTAPYITQIGQIPVLSPSESELFVALGVSIDAQIIPVGDEMTVGFHIEPTAGYGIGGSSTSGLDFGYILQSPLIAQFNYGNFSSVDASLDYGFSFGLGMLAHYQLRPDKPTYAEEGKSMLFLPTAQLSFRFWGPMNTLYSVKLSHSFGAEDLGGISHNRSVSFLTVTRSLNF